jgi:rod shape-determining protein MreC
VLDFDGSRKARRREAAIAAGIFLLALIIFFLPESYQAPLQRITRNSVLKPFLTAQSALASRRARSVDVTEIRAQRDSLVALVSAQATLAEENHKLRELTGLMARAGTAIIPAEVLRLGVGPAESLFMINKGKADGVTVNSPVIAPEGLLGIVVNVDEHLAVARDWTHEMFAASAMTVNGSAMGIVEVRRGRTREMDMMVLNGASFHVDIQPGTPVVTTGRGNIFPRGIPLGVVLGIEEADAGWSKSYLLRPAVRPEGVTSVLVGINQPTAADLSELWQITSPTVFVIKPPDTTAAAAPTRPRPRRDTTTVRRDTALIRRDTAPPITTTGNF